MAATQADIAAQLIERLLSDPAFRARFRRNPAVACREAGLEELAEEMSLAAGGAMHTLDIRESRSSLAGVLMAAAMEGMGVYEFSRHVAPAFGAVPEAVNDVLSRLHLPSVPGGGALAGGHAPAAPLVDGGGSPDAPGAVAPDAAAAAGGKVGVADEPDAAAKAAAKIAAESSPQARQEQAIDDALAQADKEASGPPTATDSPDGPTAPSPDAAAPSGGRVDPAQFGVEGAGGPPSPQALALLDNKNVVLDANGIADLKAGKLDPRLLAVLTKLSEQHKITVSCTASDHPKFTTGGSVSNHFLGRGADIAAIDGVPVNASNFDAREIATQLSELDPSMRPDEIGSPFAIAGPGFFTDADHQDHIHVGFKQPVDPGFEAPGASAPPPAAEAVAAAPAAAPAPAAEAVDPRRSGSFLAAGAHAEAAARHSPRASAGFLKAVEPTRPAAAHAAADAPAPAHELAGVSDTYPGDNATKAQFAAWMGKLAERRGLPRELPVMAALTESGLQNLGGGDRDSVGFFQMRVGIWNQGAYAGYPDKPELQVKWFLDQAEAVKKQRIANGQPVDDPDHYGDWIADVERPAAQYRGRYAEHLKQAQALFTQAPRPAHLAATDPPAPARDLAAPAGGGPAPDPDQLGMAGSGGAVSPEARAVLDSPRIVLDANGRADFSQGRIDPRIASVLLSLAKEHKLTISATSSDHPKLTTGGSVSNHFFGRAVDIAAIDGQPVSSGSAVAREVASAIAQLKGPLRPSEVGSPWPIGAPGFFTDGAHQNHIHVAFDDPVGADFRAPAEVAPAPAAAPAPAPAPEAVDPRRSGSFLAAGAHAKAAATPSPRASAGFLRAVEPARPTATPAAADAPAPAGTPRPAQLAATDPAAVADAVPPPALATTAAPQALAALKEAEKYMGTPYKWGGSTPQTGFDCSGLVQWAYAKAGIRIPRVTDQQILATNGTAVRRSELLAGDLVFFRDATGYVHHVGMSLGGDKFVHAPHTGDVVKVSSLKEPYYAQQFTGGRRFAAAGAGARAVLAAEPAAPAAAAAPAVDARAVAEAQAAVARDAAEARRHNSAVFLAIKAQEEHKEVDRRNSMMFLKAVDPKDATPPAPAAPDPAAAPAGLAASATPPDAAASAAPAGPAAAPGPHAGVAEVSAAHLAGIAADYPGDRAPRPQLAAWLARQAEKHGLPRELPVMASLVESDVQNLPGGDRDSVGFFQMRVGIWNKGAYAGYPQRPELQIKWFIDHALAVKRQRIAAGDADFGRDPSKWGEWIADVERPAAQFRHRYQERLEQARAMLARAKPAGRR